MTFRVFRTLRFKLTFLITAVFALLLVGACVFILDLRHRGMLDDIDDRLRDRAKTILDDFIAVRDNNLGMSASVRRRPYIDPPTRFPNFYVQFRDDTARIVFRSKKLQIMPPHASHQATQPTSAPARTYGELMWTDAARSTHGRDDVEIETTHGPAVDALVPDGSGIRMLTQWVDPASQPHLTIHPRQRGVMPFYLQVGLSLADLEDSMSDLRQVLLIVTPVVLLVAGFASWLLARRSLAPIGRIAREARELTAMRLDHRIPVPEGHDEVAELALTINEMLDRLENAFRAQERFVADAAHELKTPVAIVLGSAEVLSQKNRTAEEYEQFVAGLQDEMQRIAQMVDSLLTLARADAGLSPTATSPVSINEMVMSAVTACQPLAVQRNVRLVPKLAMPVPSAPEPSVMGDDDLLHAMTSNLIRNAIRFSPSDAAVEVEVTTQDGEVRVAVRDSGPGIDPVYLPRVFDRFFQAPTDVNRMKGSGLGLAIAKGVARLHRGEISVENRPGGGCEFAVRLPITAG